MRTQKCPSELGIGMVFCYSFLLFALCLVTCLTIDIYIPTVHLHETPLVPFGKIVGDVLSLRSGKNGELWKNSKKGIILELFSASQPLRHG